MRNFIYVSPSPRGNFNLAVDEYFLDHVGKEDMILYFYKNDPAVIIGKNQNPYIECDLTRMKEDGVTLVRRVSGGGAVYHDGGNLNFSFIAGEERYDKERQLNLICKTLQALGIPCEFSGRNDLLSNGKKFSGNAFAARKGRLQHHGTLLVSSDLHRLSNYLTVDPKKIRSKGISSVRSRVCNLSEILPTLTVEQLLEALIENFEKEYGKAEPIEFSEEERTALESYRLRHESEEWCLGQTPKFDFEWRERLPWGGVQLFFTAEKGKISTVKVFSDAMNTELSQEVERLLQNLDATDAAIRGALRSSAFEEVRSLADFSFLET